jgi:hypothetical protein
MRLLLLPAGMLLATLAPRGPDAPAWPDSFVAPPGGARLMQEASLEILGTPSADERALNAGAARTASRTEPRAWRA